MGYTSPVQFWCVVASSTVGDIKLSHFLDLSLQQETGFYRSAQCKQTCVLLFRFVLNLELHLNSVKLQITVVMKERLVSHTSLERCE